MSIKFVLFGHKDALSVFIRTLVDYQDDWESSKWLLVGFWLCGILESCFGMFAKLQADTSVIKICLHVETTYSKSKQTKNTKQFQDSKKGQRSQSLGLLLIFRRVL